MLPDLRAMWNFGDPAGSEQRFLQLAATLTEASERAEALTQVARAQGLQRRFDEARATLSKAESLIGNARGRARIRCLLERGRVENSSGRVDAAVPYFEQAWALATAETEDDLAVDAAHMLGIVMPDEAGATWNARALALAESSSNPAARRWTASLRNNMGWRLHDRGRFDEALVMFEQARTDRQKMDDRAGLLVARWAVARCLRSLGRVSDALAEQFDLLRTHEQAGSADGFVHEEIGECLIALGRLPDARPHFQRALELLAPPDAAAHVPAERVARWRIFAA